jgi:hypothetical protein
MRRLALAAAALATGVLSAVPAVVEAQTPWVLIGRAAAQRVHHMRSEAQRANEPYHDFATVILEAPADRVYATALELARKNLEIRILMTDPAARRLQVAEGDRVATLSVVPFSADVSQLMVAGTAGPGEDSTASRVVQAVLRVCTEMKKECQLAR